MIHVEPISINDRIALGIIVELPKTTLLVVSVKKGYIMCGALDVDLLNRKLKDRGIVAGRAVGVRTIGDLLEAPLESVTIAAEEMGILKGMAGRDAIKRMMDAE